MQKSFSRKAIYKCTNFIMMAAFLTSLGCPTLTAFALVVITCIRESPFVYIKD